MKITSLLLCAVMMAAINAAAQHKAEEPDYAIARQLPGTVERVDDSSYIKPGYMNSISIAAVRDFTKRFKTLADPRWFKLADGAYVVKFEEPGILYRAAYNSRGRWVYTIRSYHEKLLPHNVRHLVKSTYYDFAITYVDEVEQYNLSDTVYIVYLEDDAGHIILRVCDGQMDIIDHFTKTNHKP